MKLGEYPDEDLLEEVKKRGFEIKIQDVYYGTPAHEPKSISIGGIRFELTA
ncbi:MAG: hypothetical protein Q8M94_11405 [Ignavibacteria bacterium]|nr:hypothetical protein [Ignavibacteria bacterium]